MKRDDVRLFPHRITQRPSQCFSCSSRKPDKNHMPNDTHRTKLISRIPKKKKHILSAYSHLQFNTLKDQCLFTSSRHCDNLEDRQKRVFSVLKALKGNAERSKPNANDKRRKRGPQGCQLVLNIAQLVEMSGFGSPPSTSLSRLSC